MNILIKLHILINFVIKFATKESFPLLCIIRKGKTLQIFQRIIIADNHILKLTDNCFYC